VNLRAEEDMAEVEAEHGTLVSEKADLEAAIAKLRAGIASLNREGRERLLTAFEQVNANFTLLFRHLFGGGEARLTLVESDDPLEAGLEILCQPPGKKLSTLSLLSGGEQTLTALALIFGVFLVNPAPICVLDEVDAPLDDANVTRFCDLLDEMCRRTETRFLIITHHAVTMSRMDRLFGVTMQEQGVSQLAAVPSAPRHGSCAPRMPSTLPTSCPRAASFCCSAFICSADSAGSGSPASIHRRAFQPGGEIGGGGDVDEALVPVEQHAVVRPGDEGRALAPLRQQDRGLQAVGQRARCAPARPAAPIRTPVSWYRGRSATSRGRRAPHLGQPRLTRPPAVVLQHPRPDISASGGEVLSVTLPSPSPSTPRSRMSPGSIWTMPISPAQAPVVRAGSNIAALPQLRGGEDLGLEKVGPAAVVAQRHQRVQRVEVALHLPEVRLEGPEGQQDAATLPQRLGLHGADELAEGAAAGHRGLRGKGRERQEKADGGVAKAHGDPPVRAGETLAGLRQQAMVGRLPPGHARQARAH
jgi:hypothetical protein